MKKKETLDEEFDDGGHINGLSKELWSASFIPSE